MARVVLFAAPDSPACTALGNRLRKARIPYAVENVARPASARLADRLGVATLPAVFIKTGRDYVRVRKPGVVTVRAALDRFDPPPCRFT